MRTNCKLRARNAKRAVSAIDTIKAHLIEHGTTRRAPAPALIELRDRYLYVRRRHGGPKIKLSKYMMALLRLEPRKDFYEREYTCES